MISILSTALALSLATSSPNLKEVRSLQVLIAIENAAEKYQVDATLMSRLAYWESYRNPRAFNPTDPHGGAHGLFQFLQPTFNKYSKLAGITEPDIWDIKQQAEVTAYMLSIGEGKQWSCYERAVDNKQTKKC